MYTLEYFAPNGELRKVEMNEKIPEERTGFVVERAVEMIFPTPGSYFPYWEEMAIRYFLMLGYSKEGNLEEGMVEIYEITQTQPELWDTFCKHADSAQVTRIVNAYNKLLAYKLNRAEPDGIKEAIIKVLDKIENYMDSPKFDKTMGRIAKVLEDKINKFDIKKSQE